MLSEDNYIYSSVIINMLNNVLLYNQRTNENINYKPTLDYKLH
jgi:hypothetical protein